MDVDQELRLRFETLADRVREKLLPELRAASEELAVRIESERAAAAAEADAAVRQTLEQDHQQRMAATVAFARQALEQEHEQRLATAVAVGEEHARRAMDEGRREGRESGRAEGIDIGRTEGIHIGRTEGIDIGRTEGIELGIRQARAAAQKASQAVRTRLAEGLRKIDAGQSLTEIVMALLDATAAEYLRAALLLVKEGRLVWWGSRGFDEVAYATEVMATPDEHDVISDAVSANAPRHLIGNSAGRPRVVADSPPGSEQFAMPVSLAGQMVAVLYAETLSREPGEQDEGWPTTIEVLARHASRALEAVTVLRTAQALSHHPPAGRRVSGSSSPDPHGTRAVQ